MDLWDIIKVMWRRWYLVAPLLLTVVAATVYAGAVLKPEYTSTASVLLVPPAEAPEAELKPGEKGNPWIQVGPVAMAEAVAIAVQSKANHDQLAEEGIEAVYEVGVLPRSSIVLVEVAAATPEEVRAAATRVIELIEDEVAKRQAPYRPSPIQLISTQLLDPGDNVEASRTGIRRGQAMILFVGLLLTTGLAIGVDALLRRRRGPGPVRSGLPPEPQSHSGGYPRHHRPDGRPQPLDDATVTLPAVRVGPGYDPAQRLH